MWSPTASVGENLQTYSFEYQSTQSLPISSSNGLSFCWSRPLSFAGSIPSAVSRSNAAWPTLPHAAGSCPDWPENGLGMAIHFALKYPRWRPPGGGAGSKALCSSVDEVGDQVAVLWRFVSWMGSIGSTKACKELY